MGIPITVQEFLEQANVSYDVIPHAYSNCSTEAAAAAHVPEDKLAKCVVLEDDDGYVVAVVPSTHRVDLDVLGRYMGRKLRLASQLELSELFFDCKLGAVPPLGMAYGCDTIIDDDLMRCGEIWFEAGDHTDLVHVSGQGFRRLMQEADAMHFSHPS